MWQNKSIGANNETKLQTRSMCVNNYDFGHNSPKSFFSSKGQIQCQKVIDVDGDIIWKGFISWAYKPNK